MFSSEKQASDKKAGFVVFVTVKNQSKAACDWQRTKRNPELGGQLSLRHTTGHTVTPLDILPVQFIVYRQTPSTRHFHVAYKPK